jgi:secondary thiamine-phosphate synthase enzyme
MVFTRQIDLYLEAECDVRDITSQVEQAVLDSAMRDGVVTVFCPGSTGGLTTIEYEDGAVADLKEVLSDLIPCNRDYQHHRRWGDDNGASHVRSALIGASLAVPFVDHRMTLGMWQQIIFINFDTRPRTRQVVIQVMGE